MFKMMSMIDSFLKGHEINCDLLNYVLFEIKYFLTYGVFEYFFSV